MPCHFCNCGVPLLPGYSGAQYHEHQPNVGFALCAFAFDKLDEVHPFVPNINASLNMCSFCKKGFKDSVHDIPKEKSRNKRKEA